MGRFLKFDSAPFPPALGDKLAPRNLACVLAEDFVQDPFWFLGCPYHGLPLSSVGKITVGNGALKMETPPQAVFRPRRRLKLCCAFDCV